MAWYSATSPNHEFYFVGFIGIQWHVNKDDADYKTSNSGSLIAILPSLIGPVQSALLTPAFSKRVKSLNLFIIIRIFKVDSIPFCVVFERSVDLMINFPSGKPHFNGRTIHFLEHFEFFIQHFHATIMLR